MREDDVIVCVSCVRGMKADCMLHFSELRGILGAWAACYMWYSYESEVDTTV